MYAHWLWKLSAPASTEVSMVLAKTRVVAHTDPPTSLAFIIDPLYASDAGTDSGSDAGLIIMALTPAVVFALA